MKFVFDYACISVSLIAFCGPYGIRDESSKIVDYPPTPCKKEVVHSVQTSRVKAWLPVHYPAISNLQWCSVVHLNDIQRWYHFYELHCIQDLFLAAFPSGILEREHWAHWKFGRTPLIPWTDDWKLDEWKLDSMMDSTHLTVQQIIGFNLHRSMNQAWPSL